MSEGDAIVGGIEREDDDGTISVFLTHGGDPEAVTELIVLCPVVGTSEIARLFGVQVDTVHKWKARGYLPPSPWTVNGLAAWPREEIVTWARLRVEGSTTRRGPRPAALPSQAFRAAASPA